jgi:hypothetical protein
MINFELNGEIHQLPQSWGEISYRQAQQLVELDKLEIDLYERAARIVSIVTGIEYDYLVSFKNTLVFNLFHQLGFMEDRPAEPIQHFEYKGNTYYVNTLEDEIYKSFVIYHKIEKAFDEKPTDAVLYKMALLCRLMGETIDDLDRDNGKILEMRAEMFRDLPADIVFKVDAFFLSIWIASEIIMSQYSEALLIQQETEKNFIAITTRNGTGKGRLIGWLKILQNLILSTTKKQARYSAGLNTK